MSHTVLTIGVNVMRPAPSRQLESRSHVPVIDLPQTARRNGAIEQRVDLKVHTLYHTRN